LKANKKWASHKTCTIIGYQGRNLFIIYLNKRTVVVLYTGACTNDLRKKIKFLTVLKTMQIEHKNTGQGSLQNYGAIGKTVCQMTQ
jgi:hypothetical protein